MPHRGEFLGRYLRASFVGDWLSFPPWNLSHTTASDGLPDQTDVMLAYGRKCSQQVAVASFLGIGFANGIERRKTELCACSQLERLVTSLRHLNLQVKRGKRLLKSRKARRQPKGVQ
ncbi:hypothetical protein SKAU_G00333700 [Synaphobranchus kaupii]|uniref:Uncharacterized protein n=1 Tax=Synaphobranchus kaupii TaxID=118154 RepID=A0A9Q1ELQ2_SYNKA|nr:hypothetical protein SKAU_G00333700 [Synaphobranchus kaupii]